MKIPTSNRQICGYPTQLDRPEPGRLLYVGHSATATVPNMYLKPDRAEVEIFDRVSGARPRTPSFQSAVQQCYRRLMVSVSK